MFIVHRITVFLPWKASKSLNFPKWGNRFSDKNNDSKIYAENRINRRKLTWSVRRTLFCASSGRHVCPSRRFVRFWALSLHHNLWGTATDGWRTGQFFQPVPFWCIRRIYAFQHERQQRREDRPGELCLYHCTRPCNEHDTQNAGQSLFYTFIIVIFT